MVKTKTILASLLIVCMMVVFSAETRVEPLQQGFAVTQVKSKPKPVCETAPTIKTIEMWLEFKRKKQNRTIRDTIKSRCIKVLRHTIQYWKPKGGHPPTNIAIGAGLSVRDAQWVIDMALEYNDRVEYLILQRLNPPQYAAVATSAWDEKSQIAISPENLERLRDPKLSTEEFHALYVSLTGENDIPEKFY